MLKSLKHRIKIWRYRRLLIRFYTLHLKNPLCHPCDALSQADEDLQEILYFDRKNNTNENLTN